MSAALSTALVEKYRLAHPLGAGGMATVYLARDLKHDRDVAIKVLHPDIAESLGRERFVREIRLAARLTHPHILPVFDSGEVDGFLFYTMPVMQGETLRERLTLGALPVDEAVRIACEVAEALDYAHRHDVVHRDIKPENILLHEGHALVADFGIGKALATAGGDTSATVTHVGVTLGTPAYMSPEQAAGDEVDGRSDLFSLGCTLYEMLTGTPPFTGATAQAIIARRFTHVPPAVAEQRPAVPEEVSRAVDRMLARLPDERLTSGAHVVRALRGEVALPARVEVPSVAVLPFANMSADPENAFFSDGITDDIIAALSKVAGLKVAARGSSFTFRGTDVDLASVGERLGVRHVLQGSVRRAGNRVRVTAQLMTATDGAQLWGERWDRDLDDIFAIQDEIARAIVGELQVRLGAATTPSAPLVVRPTEDLEAYELYLRGREAIRRRTPSTVALGVELLGEAVRRDPKFVAAYAGLVEGHSVSGNFGFVPMHEARARALDAVARAESLGVPSAAIEIQRALIDMMSSDRWFEAGELFRAVAARGVRDPFMMGYLMWWQVVMGEHDTARVTATRLLDIDPLSPWSHTQAAGAFLMMGEAEQALALLDTAVRIDPQHAYATVVRASVLDRLGRHEEAIDCARRGAALIEEAPFGRGIVALVLAGAGRFEEARVIADEIRDRHPTHVIGLVHATVRLDAERLEHAVARAVEFGETPLGTVVPIRRELDAALVHPTIGAKLRQLAFYRGLARAAERGVLRRAALAS